MTRNHKNFAVKNSIKKGDYSDYHSNCSGYPLSSAAQSAKCKLKCANDRFVSTKWRLLEQAK
jgi:hypothetical protein